MSKRTKADTLTGGSRDVSPQLLKLVISQTGADVPTEQQYTLPVQRLPNSSGRALVMEMLGIYWDVGFVGNIAGNAFSILAQLTTKSLSPLNPIASAQALAQFRSQGPVISYINRQSVVPGGGTPTYQETDDPVFFPLHDGAGHGILVATDNVYLQLYSVIAGSTGTLAVQAASCMILYRWKEIGLAEYIGIVQSQQ